MKKQHKLVIMSLEGTDDEFLDRVVELMKRDIFPNFNDTEFIITNKPVQVVIDAKIRELERGIKEALYLIDQQAETIKTMLNTEATLTVAIAEFKNKKREVEEALAKYIR